MELGLRDVGFELHVHFLSILYVAVLAGVDDSRSSSRSTVTTSTVQAAVLDMYREVHKGFVLLFASGWMNFFFRGVRLALKYQISKIRAGQPGGK
jgi:hypothetical protein